MRRLLVLTVQVAAVVLMACGSTQSPSAASRRQAATSPSPFVGAWKGTKQYLSPTGEVLATASDWVFEITSDTPGDLKFTNGPAALATGTSDFQVGTVTYAPAWPPQAPGGSSCGPIVQAITGGTGSLAADGLLAVTLHWTTTCGGATTESVAAYSMRRVESLAPWEVASL